MPRRESNIVLRPSQGGRLTTGASAENVGPANYLEKTNWRRMDDREVAREGAVLFRPNLIVAQGSQALNAASAVTGMWEAVRPNGQRSVVVATQTTLHRYAYATGTWDNIGSGFSNTGKRWQAVSLDGYLILNNGVDLPVSFRVEDNAVVQLKELREIGVAAAGTVAVFNGFLLFADITEILSAELAGVMSGGSPYGVVASNKTQRVRYKIAWSDYNNPTNWAPLITGTIQSATKNKVTLAYPVSAFTTSTKVAVIGAAADGGTLGGDEANPDGITISSISGAELTLAVSANASLTYPLTVQVTRFSDVSTFAGSAQIQDDSTAVTRMLPLNRGILAIYRESSIFHARYTGEVENPFVFTPAYNGRNVPFYPDAVQELTGDRHVYPTENSFYVYDGAGEPRLFAPLDDAKELFFTSLTASSVFAAHNPITKELWFCTNNGVLAYDYVSDTASWIDEAYTSAGYVRKPDGTSSTDPSDFWFLCARAGRVLRYGLTLAGVATYTRIKDDDATATSYTATLRGGLAAFGDEHNEKDLLSYAPVLSSPSADVDVTVTLYGTDQPANAVDLLCTVALTNPTVTAAVPTFFRNIYFRDSLSVAVNGSGVQLSARRFTVRRVASDGVTLA